jgi:inorganic triphosphatase YgiF
MSAMQEIELKFQIPAEALADVRAKLTQLAQAQPQPDLRLRAAYFDTPDRKLAGARMALRLRQEGDEWVQTLKAGGSNTMMRLEDNQPFPAPADALLQPDLGRHVPMARHSLQQVLGWDPQTDPSGQQCQLIELWGTDITRTRVRCHVASGTPFQGEVELALDLGHIRAGTLREPVRELEIESMSGHPMAVILAGREWVQSHGLWLDTQTKAHRGDRLARMAARGQTGAATEEVHVTPAQAARWDNDATLAETWQRGLERVLEHLTANLSELATASRDTDALCYEVRLALRRLRALGRLWADTPLALPDACLDKATVLSDQLAYWRDQTALAWLPERIRSDGGPELTLPCPSAAIGQPPSPAHWARTTVPTTLCLDLLTCLLQDLQADSHRFATQPAAPWLVDRLANWHRHCLQDGQHPAQLSEHTLHALRKKGKRLRLMIELFDAAWPHPRATARYLDSLKNALGKLGQLQDEAMAESWFQTDTTNLSAARFAVQWLRTRRPRMRQQANEAVQSWLHTPLPW